MPMTITITKRLVAGTCAVLIGVCGEAASAQNDWQAPDPYFGVFQHRQAATPEAERRYRAEIAPQQPQRLHEQRPHQPVGPVWRPRAYRQRLRPSTGR